MKPMTFFRGRRLLLPATALLCLVASACTKNDDDPSNGPSGTDPVSVHRILDERILYKFPYDLDLNTDGVADYRIGSAVEGDGKRLRMTFYVDALGNHQVLAAHEEMLAGLRAGEPVTVNDPSWSGTAHLLCEKYLENGVVTWTGAWSGGQALYLPIRFDDAGVSRMGWIKTTVDLVTHDILLHEAALDLSGASILWTGDF